VDGDDIRDVGQDSLGRQMSVVLQEPYLFSGSVRENIRYNRVDATDEEVESAAKAVGAHDFIERLSEGYDTELQERGGNLSVGQRQLISFARALVADPRILILDEATANIDTHTELQIQRALGELLRDRTALVIAHRLSTVRNADKIVVLEDGRKVEEGNHDELMAVDGLYARLQSYSFESNGAQEPTLDGTWSVTVNSPRGTQNGTLELTASGTSFSGVWEGPRGTREFEGGKIDQGNVAWEVEMSGPRGTMSLSFSGDLTGDQISGKVQFGSFGEGSFLATRSRG
jgi:ABC-type multidrug transport system ATPase subunit